MELLASCILLLLFIGTNGIDQPIFLNHGLGPGNGGCKDNDPKCTIWANQGECESNGAWMMANCRRSCQSCQGGEKAWKLRSHIAKTYDNVTTAVNAFLINQILVESFHVTHLEVDESTQTATIHGRLVMTWNDTRLRWDRDKWGVSWLNFYWIQIWAPKLIQKNRPQPYEDSSYVTWRSLAANHTGQVFMWADFALRAVCPFDYGSYPRDAQRCCFELDDKRHYTVRFNVSDNARASGAKSATEAYASGWSLSDVSLVTKDYVVQVRADWKADPYDVRSTALDVCVTMDRRPSYVAAQIVGPCIATAIVTLSSFLLITMRAQMAMLVANLGLQFLSIQTLQDKLPPPTQNVPTIVSFYSVNLALTVLSLILIVCLELLASLRTLIPPPRCLDKFTNVIARFYPCIQEQGSGTGDSDGKTLSDDPPSQPQKSLQWAPLAQVIRATVFLIFLAVYIFATQR